MRSSIIGVAAGVMALAWPGVSGQGNVAGSAAAHPAGGAKGQSVETQVNSESDHEVLLALNEDYIRSVQTSDVQRFDEILAKDFRASLGAVILDREGFLQQTAQPVTISNLEAHDVEIRIMGDFALVHARTTYTTADGETRTGRYTDVWARQDGRWLAVAAHVTR